MKQWITEDEIEKLEEKLKKNDVWHIGYHAIRKIFEQYDELTYADVVNDLDRLVSMIDGDI